MEFWNVILSVGLATAFTAVGYQLKAIRENTRRLDSLEGANPVKRVGALEDSSSDMDARITAIEAQERRLDTIEDGIKKLPERIAALEAHDIRTTTDQLHSRVSRLGESVAKFDGTVLRLEQTVTDMNAWLMSQKSAR